RNRWSSMPKPSSEVGNGARRAAGSTPAEWHRAQERSITLRTTSAGSPTPHTRRSQALMTSLSWSRYGKSAAACFAAIRPSRSPPWNRSYESPASVQRDQVTTRSRECQCQGPASQPCLGRVPLPREAWSLLRHQACSPAIVTAVGPALGVGLGPEQRGGQPMAPQLVNGTVADRPRFEVWPGNPVATLWDTMVGKKVVMAATGVVLIGFVIAHMLGNLKIFLGPVAIDTYAVFLRTVGEPLVPYGPMLGVVRIALLTCVARPITAAVQLTRMSRAARPHGYETKAPIATAYAGRAMRWSPVILFLFIVYHLLHMTGGVVGFQPGQFRDLSVYHNVVGGFSVGFGVSFFLVAMVSRFLPS